MLMCKKCLKIIVNSQPITHYSICYKCRRKETGKSDNSNTVSIRDINKQIAKEMKDEKQYG